METTNMEQTAATGDRVKWGVKLRFEPVTQAYELKIILPVGDEDNLLNLLDASVVQAFPEMLRALNSGRLPGNELDLTNPR
jgi:hypothetical protein